MDETVAESKFTDSCSYVNIVHALTKILDLRVANNELAILCFVLEIECLISCFVCRTIEDNVIYYNRRATINLETALNNRLLCRIDTLNLNVLSDSHSTCSALSSRNLECTRQQSKHLSVSSFRKQSFQIVARTYYCSTVQVGDSCENLATALFLTVVEEHLILCRRLKSLDECLSVLYFLGCEIMLYNSGNSSVICRIAYLNTCYILACRPVHHYVTVADV